MIVLGVDPGYRNLGLAAVQVGGSTPSILDSWNGSAGPVSDPLRFVRTLWPRLDAMHAEHGFEAVACETPPMIMKQIQTTAYLWAVVSVIASWAHSHDLPFRHASPISLKKATAKALGRPWHPKLVPTKGEVKRVVERATGLKCRTSHEADAALAVLCIYAKEDLLAQAPAHP